MSKTVIPEHLFESTSRKVTFLFSRPIVSIVQRKKKVKQDNRSNLLNPLRAAHKTRRLVSLPYPKPAGSLLTGARKPFPLRSGIKLR